MVGREHDDAVLRRQRLHDLEQRRVREPRAQHRAERGLVRGQLGQQLGLAAAVRHDVDEVEHE